VVGEGGVRTRRGTIPGHPRHNGVLAADRPTRRAFRSAVERWKRPRVRWARGLRCWFPTQNDGNGHEFGGREASGVGSPRKAMETRQVATPRGAHVVGPVGVLRSETPVTRPPANPRQECEVHVPGRVDDVAGVRHDQRGGGQPCRRGLVRAARPAPHVRV
jgi:hypothetical protein